MCPIKIKVRQYGKNTEEYLKNAKTKFDYNSIKKLADDSLSDFKAASPTFEIMSGWYYEIKMKNNGFILDFNNSAESNGNNIAFIVDVGHVSNDGKWISGKNYLKEPIKKLYEKINKLLQEDK